MKVLKYIHAIYVPYIKFHQLFLYVQNFWVSGFNMNQGDRSEPPKLPKTCVWVWLGVCVCVCVCSMCVGYRYIFAGYGCISPKFFIVVVNGILQNKKMTHLFLEYSKWDTDVSKYDLPFGLG